MARSQVSGVFARWVLALDVAGNNPTTIHKDPWILLRRNHPNHLEEFLGLDTQPHLTDPVWCLFAKPFQKRQAVRGIVGTQDKMIHRIVKSSLFGGGPPFVGHMFFNSGSTSLGAFASDAVGSIARNSFSLRAPPRKGPRLGHNT